MDRAQQIGVFRWRIVGEAADVSLSARERGALVRALAAREHLGPDGRWVRVSRNTLDRWIRAYREGGFEALAPAPRRVANRTPERLSELAVALRREQPARTAAQIHRIIVEAEGSAPTARTIQRHLAAVGLAWKGGQVARALGRFEAEFRNELWTGDALHGPLIDGRRAILFCFLDDHSRLLCGYRWAAREDVLNASRALRAGIAARGVPKAVYVDNGSPFVSGQLLRACAVLGIRLIHSRPGRPEGRGKIERAFRTVRQQLLVELDDRPPASLEELNQLFQAWVESVYHRRAHTETGQAPLERFLAAGAPTLPAERALRERWDGAGYPDGLRAEAIPLVARICAVCDVFDALMSARPYKPAWTLADALAELAAQRGRQFDPALVDAFLALALAPALAPELLAPAGDPAPRIGVVTLPAAAPPPQRPSAAAAEPTDTAAVARKR